MTDEESHSEVHSAEESHWNCFRKRWRSSQGGAFCLRGDPAKGRREARVFSCRGDPLLPVPFEGESPVAIKPQGFEVVVTGKRGSTRLIGVKGDTQEEGIKKENPLSLPGRGEIQIERLHESKKGG